MALPFRRCCDRQFYSLTTTGAGPDGGALMADQAEGLRALAERMHAADPPASGGARTIAVTSGKGGVGKTNLATNLALHLARSGRRTAVLDADLGLANIHVLLGVTPPGRLDQVVTGERDMRDILYTGPYGLIVAPGGSDLPDIAALGVAGMDRVAAGLAELDRSADLVLIDTGAGLSPGVMMFLQAADEVIVVTTPEPTALADAYATMKVLARNKPGARVRLVVNMVSGEAEALAVYKRLSLVGARYLGVEPRYLGFVPIDPAVGKAVRAQKPFVLADPAAPASRAVERIGAALGLSGPQTDGMTGFVGRVRRLVGRQGAASP